MQEVYERIKEAEEQRRGLVIVEAWYGSLTSAAAGDASQQRFFYFLFINNYFSNYHFILCFSAVNVAIAMQVLIKDSKLILPPSSKVSFKLLVL